MAKQKKKTRHHYIPQFYLTGFIDPDNEPCIWIYDKNNPARARKDIAKNIAFQHHYHSFTNKEGDKDSETVENFFSQIEGLAAPVFQKINRKEKLNEEDRMTFASFLALIAVRVPNFRRNVETATAEIVKKDYQIFAAHEEGFKSYIRKIEEDTGEKINMPIEKLRNFFLDNNGYSIQVDPAFSLAIILPLAMNITQVFFDMNWKFFLATEDYKFVTSDNPLYYCDPTHDPQSFYGVGLINENIEVTFPISKDIAFFATWKDSPKGNYIQASNQLVKQITKRTVISAKRFIFSSRKANGLNALVQKYKAFSPTIRIS